MKKRRIILLDVYTNNVDKTIVEPINNEKFAHFAVEYLDNGYSIFRNTKDSLIMVKLINENYEKF